MKKRINKLMVSYHGYIVLELYVMSLNVISEEQN